MILHYGGGGSLLLSSSRISGPWRMDLQLQDHMQNTVMLEPMIIHITGIFNGQTVASVSNSPREELFRDRAKTEVNTRI